MEFTYKNIGIINTPYKTREGMPIQPTGAKGIKGKVEIKKEYVEGLKDLDGFSHVILIYSFHQSEGYQLAVTPFMDNTPRGVFSTRAPQRPNSIGISVVELLRIEGNTLHIENVDMLNGTPLLDIKPFITTVDNAKEYRLGWLEGKAEKMSLKKADKRFSNE